MKTQDALMDEARIVAHDDLASLIDHAAPQMAEVTATEFPKWVWGMMAGGYITFFACMIGATAGGGYAIFSIVISILYTAMYFGTARILFGVDPRTQRSFDTHGSGKLETYTGPMSARDVAGQVVLLPVLLGFFGIAILLISAIVF